MSQPTLQMVLDESPVTISWVGSDLRYKGANRALAELCGVNCEEFVGKPVGFLTKEVYFRSFLEELFESNENRLSRELATALGEETHWHFVVGRKYNGGQDAVVIGVDVTKLKLAEEQMVFREKMATLGEMAVGIVHEISNPLTIIVAKSDALKRLDIADTELKKDVLDISDKLKSTAIRMNQIVQGLKGFSRSSAQEQPHDTRLQKIIADSIEIMAVKSGQFKVMIINEVSDTLHLNCREIQMGQVVVNLISNAIDAVKDLPERWVKISTREIPEYIEILFTDSGGGIPREIIKKLFNPFYTTKEIGSGNGLGLCISRGIVEKHGGNMYVDTLCKNTRFVVRLKK